MPDYESPDEIMVGKRGWNWSEARKVIKRSQNLQMKIMECLNGVFCTEVRYNIYRSGFRIFNSVYRKMHWHNTLGDFPEINFEWRTLKGVAAVRFAYH